ncbi:putative ribonuclease H-like domain-containing protein [Tanacetum coccineum]
MHYPFTHFVKPFRVSLVYKRNPTAYELVTSVPAAATIEVKTSESRPKPVSEPLIEDWVSNSENENETESKSRQRKPSIAKVEFVKSSKHVKSPRESVKKVENSKQANYPRKNSQSPRGNKRNWNNLMTQKLGSNFEFKNKACFVCGSFNHLIKDCDFYEKKMVEKPVWNNARRVNHQNSQRMTHPHPKRNFVPRAVLMKSGLKILNTARQNSSRAAISVNTARPINTVYPKPIMNSEKTALNVFNRAHSHVIRLFNKFTTNKNSNFNEKVNTVRENVTTVGTKAVVSDNKGNEANAVKASACWVWRPKHKVLDHGNPQLELQEKGVINSGCSRHMTGNKSYLSNYEEIDGGFVAFGRNAKGGKITRKGKIMTGKLDFEDVYFVKELKFNLFSVSQICDKKNSVLFTDTECVVLSSDFKLTDENHILLKVPRKNNMYSIDLRNVVPQVGLTCLFAKATLDESNLWHRRLGHINFKTMNKLVRGNLVRGLPSKIFENNHTCVACQKGKQHKASFVTDDFSRFSWVFFLATKDETSGNLKAFITGIENQINHKVKIIRCDNGTEFKNMEMNQFYKMKRIKREFSVARTPQQNGVAERKNRTLIEAARTMLANLKLLTTFWAEAVNIACYVQNRVLVIKPHNKTPYKLFNGRTPTISFMRPFGYLVTILNTLDHPGKFNGKANEGFFIGYSVNSKAFRVFNSRTRIVEETLHITFLKNKPNVAGSRPEWLFDIDTLTKSMNYKPVIAENQTNGNAGTKESIDVGQARKKTVPSHEYILLPLWTTYLSISSSLKISDDKVSDDVEKRTTEDPAKEDDKDNQNLREFERLIVQRKEAEININSTNSVSAVSSLVNTAGTKDVDVNSTNNIYTASPLVNFNGLSTFNANPPDDPKMPNLEDIGIFGGAYDDEDFVAGGDMNNLESSMPVSPIATTRVHKDHPVKQIIRDLHSAPQTRRMTKNSKEHGLMGLIQKQRRTNHKDFQNCLFAYFLSQVEPKKRAIGTKWVYRNKKDERGIVVTNKARLVAQGCTQEEGIDYDDVFAPVARIKAIRLFLAYASFMNFVFYQMDVKSAFLYGKIEEEVYVYQPPGFEDPEFPDRVYEVEKALYGLHQDPGACQDKYVDEILKKFGFSTVRIASTPIETSKPLLKDAEAEDVDVHLYRSMIRPLMYLTASRPDIMFVVYSPFDLEAYSDNDYVGASFDRKSTIGGCQFLGSRLISWQCKKQTIVANSTTKAEDLYEKRLIQVIKIHTDHNVADLLTKALDVSHFQFLTASIGMLNL